MRRWPLKVKFGLYAAALTTLGIAVTGPVVMSLIYHNQLDSLDHELSENAAELFRDLDNFRGEPVNPRKPVSQKFIPVSLRGRYLQLEGPEGQVLLRSANLGEDHLDKLAPVINTPGMHTVVIAARDCRIGTFREGAFTLHIGTRMGTIERMQSSLRFGFLWVSPALGCVVFGLGWLLGRRALRPVSEMTAAAVHISAAAPGERLPVPGSGDELARLSEVLNETFDRLQRAYEAARHFSGNASHQLKTPLTVLRAGLGEFLRDPRLDADQREQVELFLTQTRRLTTLADDLLLLAQAEAGRLRVEAHPVDLVPLASLVLDDVEILAAEAGTRLENELPRSLFVRGDERRLSMILQNLGENAVKYNQPGGRLRVTASDSGGMVSVVFANTGPGIAPEHRDRIFEPFERGTLGEDVRGHGLGLAIARELTRAQGGDLLLKRADSEWTEFELRLPTAPNDEKPTTPTL